MSVTLKIISIKDGHSTRVLALEEAKKVLREIEEEGNSLSFNRTKREPYIEDRFVDGEEVIVGPNVQGG